LFVACSVESRTWGDGGNVHVKRLHTVHHRHRDALILILVFFLVALRDVVV
jgi:hypothetical protein